MAELKLNKTENRDVRGRPKNSGMTNAFKKICD